jgi:predicted nucleic acid-binding protein
MGCCVLDASMAAAWCFADEASEAGWALLDRIADEGALVPSLWHLEMANLLTQAERRGRIDRATAGAMAETLMELPISVDTETPVRALGIIRHLAETEGLSSYDAAYLELAIRTALPLASRDRALLAAARRAGLKTIEA